MLLCFCISPTTALKEATGIDTDCNRGNICNESVVVEEKIELVAVFFSIDESSMNGTSRHTLLEQFNCG
jgi:hypothetical protein